MTNRRQFMAAGLAAGAWSWMRPEPAAAQLAGNAFIVSGFPPGGIGDLISRPLAEKLRGQYATNMVVDSKVGAGGRLAAEFVKRSAPDGLTILQIPGSVITLYPHIYRTLNYEPLTDFIPVTTTCNYSYSFTASSALPAEIRTVADYVAWARANPKKSSYGIPAAGSALHFAGMMLQQSADIEFTAVPYRGGAPLLTDMLAGVLPVSFNVLGEVLPHVRSGKLRSLGVVSSERSPFLPDVPTMIEQGIKEVTPQEWLGWFVPAKTPNDIVQKLNGLVRAGLQALDMIESLANGGLRPSHTTPDEFGMLVKQNYDAWARIAQATGFKAAE